MRTAISLAIAASLAGCAYPYSPPAIAPASTPAPGGVTAALPPAALPPAALPPSAASDTRTPVTILVSIDGFRPDYLDRGVTPNLNRLKAGGVFAAMRPSFPSITFPNHWSLVTGLRPDRTGIVGNTMEDAARPGETFTMASDDPFWWNAAEPIWVTAEKAGIRTATMFWPGANVAFGGIKSTAGHGSVTGGIRPHDWQQFNQAVSGEQRVDAVIDWLRRPAATRPRFVTLYFDVVDSAGHTGGPDDPRTTAAVLAVDTQIGALVAGLATLGQPANLVIVADHGMDATSDTRTIPLASLADPATIRTIETGPYAAIVPLPGHEVAAARALLAPHAHATCWAKPQIPARLHYGANPRVPSYVCLAEPGWLIVKTAPTAPFSGGAHGYDNDSPSMRALFLANGPAFTAGRTLPTFDNVDVAPLLRDLLRLPAGQGLDGDDAPFRPVLQR